MIFQKKIKMTNAFGISLVPKLPLGNLVAEAPASCDGKLELPEPNSQAGAWELAGTCRHFRAFRAFRGQL